MILPDVNVLVHAHNADSAVHVAARQWWDGCLAGSEGVGFAWATVLAFVRITTNRKIVARPLAVGEVMARLQAWLELPHVHVVQPSDAHFSASGTCSSGWEPPET
jgi:toxin-antitoxin system PIN domain toxin